MVKRYYYIAILTISLTRGNGQRAPDVKQRNKGCTVNNSRQIAIT